MAKTKHEETIDLYCTTCKFLNVSVMDSPCRECLENARESYQYESGKSIKLQNYSRTKKEELKMDKTKHEETRETLEEISPCGMCKYHLVFAFKDPCRECLKHASTVNSNGERIYENFVPKHEGLAGGKKDNVNHPSHYESSTSIECIQAMVLIFGEDAVADFCACNAFKYMWRYKHKNGMEDLKKAEWYLSYLGKMREDDPYKSGTFDPEVSNRLASLLEELMKKEQ